MPSSLAYQQTHTCRTTTVWRMSTMPYSRSFVGMCLLTGQARRHCQHLDASPVPCPCNVLRAKGASLAVPCKQSLCTCTACACQHSVLWDSMGEEPTCRFGRSFMLPGWCSSYSFFLLVVIPAHFCRQATHITCLCTRGVKASLSHIAMPPFIAESDVSAVCGEWLILLAMAGMSSTRH